MTLFSFDLTKKFIILIAGLVLMVAFSAQLFFTRQESNALELRLREKATFINNFYAFLIADALTRKDDITLSMVINRLEEDPEISSVMVVDQRGDIRYHIDPEQIGAKVQDKLVETVLQSSDGVVTSITNSGGKALLLVSPLKVQGQPAPIGAVRIEMTYRRNDKQIADGEANYRFTMLGLLVFSVGLVLTFLQSWVLAPLANLKQSLESVNPRLPEASLPESWDQFGKINAAMNELMLRFRAEMQNQQSDTSTRGVQEKEWVDRLVRSFLPESRVILADRENIVLSDTGNGAGPIRSGSKHLLDLITDSNFANLVTTAYQTEGNVVRGPVTFEDKPYQAAILSVPSHQTRVVKTLIALRPETA